mmetsp:Transcript_4228/g.7870  ORF Transcript_4228/g.7870 Transcript_4228/m.7870 type:complete len:149 (-) Transcript_4228:2171-2617(-)
MNMLSNKKKEDRDNGNGNGNDNEVTCNVSHQYQPAKQTLKILLCQLRVWIIALICCSSSLRLARVISLDLDTSNSRTGTVGDGCGLINNRNSSTWIDLAPPEIHHFVEVEECVRRIFYATKIGTFGLSCDSKISLDILRFLKRRFIHW